MIPVTKPFLPPQEEYEQLLQGIWQRNWLTNNGPLVQELEEQLKSYLRIPNLLFLNNGTIALQLAIKALKLRGEIITTPFSYVATSSSIVWEGCQPVFADINPGTLNIDPEQIERHISPRTSAILATHVYGNPCEVEAIQSLANRHGLKVIYDAAHAFGSQYKDQSLFAYGDVSTASFHATKLFHTIEGGAVISADEDLNRSMAYLRNFGHDGPEQFAEVGINGKNSEFHAAMGLVNLRYIDTILARRREIARWYNQRLQVPGIQHLRLAEPAHFNWAYYPILLESEAHLLRVVDALHARNIFPRRYFFPALHTVPSYATGQSLPVAESASRRVLSLPMYFDLREEEVELICKAVLYG
jgi:dTDP-4-amino-4,6-dideoxygalactose transaminase